MLPNRRTSRFSARRQSPPRDGSAGPESGQALAELAFVVTIILVMALAVFDLGLGFYNAMLLNQGARDGARVAIDCSTSIGQIQSAALAAAPPGAAVTVVPNPRPACPASNSSDVQTTVTVSYAHQWITPFWGGGNSTTISQSAAAR